MELIRLSRPDGGVAQLTLARPGRRNAINPQMADEIAEAVARILEWDVRVAILAAEGPVFCAGADIGDIAASRRAVVSVVDTLTIAPIHWTAVVRHPVYGAGLSLVTACPRVLAVPSAVFALPELAHGFFPGELMSGQIAALGVRGAFDLAFSAAPIEAGRAAELGLVSQVVAEEEIEALALGDARMLATRGASAVLDGIALWQAHIRSRLLG